MMAKISLTELFSGPYGWSVTVVYLTCCVTYWPVA